MSYRSVPAGTRSEEGGSVLFEQTYSTLLTVRWETAAGNTLALQVDSEGNVRYDAIAQQGQRDGKIVQSQFKDLVPLAHRKDVSDEARSMERPSDEEVQATAER